MKKTALFAISWLLSVSAFAQFRQIRTIIPTEELPKPEKFLPGYANPGEQLFILDSLLYEIGKSKRDTPRGELAQADASTSVSYYLKRFGEAMGNPEMTRADYPALAELIEVTFTHARNGNESAKKHYRRERPYDHFNEHNLPADRNKDLTSYPSGHTVRAWAIAMALVGIDPAHQDEILKVGYELGQSRVILGFHYQSDVDAARLSASAAFARLCTQPEWLELFNKAKQEYESKKAAQQPAAAA